MKRFAPWIAPIFAALICTGILVSTPIFAIADQWISGFLRDSSGNLDVDIAACQVSCTGGGGGTSTVNQGSPGPSSAPWYVTWSAPPALTVNTPAPVATGAHGDVAVEGTASMTALQVTGVGGSPVPANVCDPTTVTQCLGINASGYGTQQTVVSSGGTPGLAIRCDTRAAIAAFTTAGAIQFNAGTTGQRVRVCAIVFEISSGTGVTMALKSGTGTTCTSGFNDIFWTGTGNASIVSAQPFWTSASGAAACYDPEGTSPTGQGFIYYTVQ